MTEGATTGRGGKGVVYFWASGNGGDPTQGGLDDSNFDAQASSRFVMAVGGVGRDGKKPDYAEGGANVLIVAPTEGNDGVGAGHHRHHRRRWLQRGQRPHRARQPRLLAGR